MAQAEHHKPHEMNLIVVGGTLTGKTSIFNLLLGQENPQSGQKVVNCVKHDGELKGRSFTVVDTPGWWKDYPLIDTAERIKHELQLSVQFCPPGPHAFILTVEIEKFTEDNRSSIEEHLGLFGERVWEHTIVMFTRGEYLKGRSIEKHIETQGVALKWVLEKCGNRYCVYDKHTKDQNLVIQLLQQIESVVVNNSGRHFVPDETTLRDVEEKRRGAQKRANGQRLKVEEKRKQLKEGGQIQPLSEIRIVILGWVCCGKSSAKNVILNKKDHAPLSRTNRWEKQKELVGDKHVTVVDTPGWWKYFSAQYTPKWVRRELEQSVSLGSKAPHALLLVVPADVSFLEEQRKIIQENMKMFGEMSWRHTLVLFTWGDTLGNTSIEEHIESEGEPLRWLVEKCGSRYHVFDNVNGDVSQVHQLLQKIEEMEASVSYCDGTQKIPETEITESHRTEEEVSKEMMEFLDKEWSRRDNTLEKAAEAMCREMSRGDRSMGNYPDFSAQENEPYLDTRIPLSSDKPEQAENEPPEQTERNMKEMFRRELAQREAVIIKKFRGIISEHIRSGVVPSEADEHDIEEATEKVLNWLAISSGVGSELGEEDDSFAE